MCHLLLVFWCHGLYYLLVEWRTVSGIMPSSSINCLINISFGCLLVPRFAYRFLCFGILNIGHQMNFIHVDKQRERWNASFSIISLRKPKKKPSNQTNRPMYGQEIGPSRSKWTDWKGTCAYHSGVPPGSEYGRMWPVQPAISLSPSWWRTECTQLRMCPITTPS